MRTTNCNSCARVTCAVRDAQRTPKTLSFEGKFEIFCAQSGCTLTVDGAYYSQQLATRFADELPLRPPTLTFCQADCTAAVRLIFGQIASSVWEDVTAVAYYECKAAEVVYMSLRPAKPANTHRQLTAEDVAVVQKIRAILDERTAEKLPIAELARLASTCQTKLQNDFKTAFGCTIHDYLQARRMAKAAKLLAESSQPIYTIAKAVGCKKAGRFSQLFKETYGVSPSEYKEQFNG